MIYFDYTATTPIDEEVLETYVRMQKNFFANSSSLHKLGQTSNYMVEKAINEIKDILKLKDHNIVFTSNATEANNLGIFGAIGKKVGKIITTKIEHPSVFEVYKKLETIGFEVVFLNVDKNGIIDLNQLKMELDKDTILVSIMWVNNIIGAIEPINEVIQFLKKFPKTKLHVDIVQGLCKIEANFDFNDIDILTFSAHKIYGPKGIGVLAYRKNIEMERRLYGSNAQFGIKPGTLDLGLIASLDKALKKFYPITKEHYQYVKEINTYLRRKIETLDFIYINSSENASPYIMNLSIPSINGETIVHLLEEKEIYVSTSSACSSKIKKPEKTILCTTNSEELATSTIRISLSHLTTKEEINKLVEVLETIKHV